MKTRSRRGAKPPTGGVSSKPKAALNFVDIEVPPISDVDFGEGESLNVDRLLRYDFSDVADANLHLPASIEWINERLKSFIEAKVMAKHRVKRAEAEAYFHLKKGEFDRLYPESKMTEKALELAIHLDEGVESMNKELAEATSMEARLRQLLVTLQLKLEIVRSQEATRRRLIDRSREEIDDD